MGSVFSCDDSGEHFEELHSVCEWSHEEKMKSKWVLFSIYFILQLKISLEWNVYWLLIVTK